MSIEELPNKEESREKLIKSAVKLFATKGFEGTTVRDIADDAGVNLSLVSYYFQGKLGLYRASIEEFGKKRSDVARQFVGKPAESMEEFRVRLTMLIEEMVSFQVANPYPCQIIMREIDQGLPHAADIFEGTLMQTYGVLVSFIADAKAKGFLREGVDPQIAPQFIQGAVFHLNRVDKVRQKYFNQSISAPEQQKIYIEQLMNLFFHGILKEERPK